MLSVAVTMAPFIFTLLVVICSTYTVNIYAVLQESYEEYHDTDAKHQSRLGQPDRLEKQIANQPAGFEALRKELKAEIRELRKAHVTEISTLKESVAVEISSLRKENEILLQRIETLDIGNWTTNREEELDKSPTSLYPTETVNETNYDMNRVNERGEEDNTIDKLTNLPNRVGRAVQKNRIRRQVAAHGVAFFATLKGDAMHLGTNQNVKFENVITNVGNAYDVHQGVFKAPVSGIYVFATTIVTLRADQSQFSLYRNSEMLTIMWLNGADSDYDDTSNTIVLSLNKGDDVCVRHIVGTDKSIHGSYHSMFSGFLLLQDDEPASIIGK